MNALFRIQKAHQQPLNHHRINWMSELHPADGNHA